MVLQHSLGSIEPKLMPANVQEIVSKLIQSSEVNLKTFPYASGLFQSLEW